MLLLLASLTASAHNCEACTRRALLRAAGAAAAAPLLPASAIVGGTSVGQAEMDARGIVGLLSDPEGGCVCSGSRIGDGLILTARHCAQQQLELRQVMFSTDLFSPGAVMRPIVDVALAEHSDMAILRYAGLAPAAHQPVSLAASLGSPQQQLVDDEWSLLTAYGYGRRADGPQATGADMGRLRRLDSRVMGATALIDNPPVLTTRPLSADEGQCFGDSGGPAFFRDARPRAGGGGFAQIGVFSEAAASGSIAWCGGGIDRFVNVALPEHSQWIDEAVASLGGQRLARRVLL